MTVTSVALKYLRIAKTNVRRSNGSMGIEMLAASIKAHGLIHPLQVRPAKKKGYYDVHVGGRRMRALNLLTQDGSIDDDYMVKVEEKQLSDEEAREISLAENAMRVAMTAADECLAFDLMLGKDKSAENVARVAANYGTTVKHIEARLRLANLAEPIFAALSDGSLTLDAAKTYGLTADRERQQAAFEQLVAIRCQNDEWRIRKLLFDDSIQASNAIALFIGEDCYREAGGRIEADLFKDADSANWTDAHIARTLATDKLTAIAEKMREEQHLGWVTAVADDNVSYDVYQHLHRYYPERIQLTDDEQAKLDTIEERISEINEMFEYGEFDNDNEEALQKELDELNEEYSTLEDRGTYIPDEDREHVGTFLYLTKDGDTRLYQQLFSTKEPERRQASGGGNSNEDSAPPMHSRSLTEDLAMTRRDILALHLANDPGLALDLAIFKLAASELYADYALGLTLDISGVGDPQGSSSARSNPAIEALAQIRRALDISWFDNRDDLGNFERFRALNDDIKASWLAYCMATSLKASLATKGNFHNPFHTMLGQIMEIDMAAHWRPSAADYFSKLRKPAILETIGRLGDPTLVSRYSNSKKGDLAEAAEKIFAGEAFVDPEIKTKALAWIPEDIGFDDTPEPAIEAAADADETSVEAANDDQTANKVDENNTSELVTA